MTEQDVAPEDRLRRAVAELTVVFENLGAEHQALRAEEAQTAARERSGTVIRMGEGIAQTARTVSLTIGVLATVHGLRDLGVTYGFSRTAEGGDYTPLLALPSSTEEILDALVYLDEAASTLGKAYAPTKKYPGLAVARCPQQMRAALGGLRAALEAVCAEAAEADAGVAEDYAVTHALLSDLEERVCRTVPAQSAGPSAEEVVAAIRADPEVARAAAAALAANAWTKTRRTFQSRPPPSRRRGAAPDPDLTPRGAGGR
ncbi:hypothetical protein AB0F20_29680 [Streptomyces goshikiensis]|uniref:hypothetical protein n=1 Tax=Streptomyces goshikiensis TaxID=1942 RepID=UPI0033E5F5C5